VSNPRTLAWPRPGLVAGALLLGAVIWLVYWPGLSGPFLFDDFQNFVNLHAVKMTALDGESVVAAIYSWNDEARLPNRGLARLTFGLDYFLAGGRFDGVQMKSVNVAVHLANALLLFVVARRLLLARAAGDTAAAAVAGSVALLGASLWALHPIQLTGVLYVVQRMTSLSATFVLLGLLCYCIGRVRLADSPARGLATIVLGTGTCVALGFFCKQNVVLLAPMALLCELCFFERARLPRLAHRGLQAFFGLCVVLPAVAALVISPWLWEWLQDDYAIRTFGPLERLMTQPRVLLLYLGLVFVPRLDAFSLWRDDLVVSTGLLSPASTAICLAAVVLLLTAGLWGLRRRSVWAFAVLFFFAGHLIESSAVALELAFEHRNYVPSMGLALAVAWYGQRATAALRLTRPSVAVLAVALAFTLGFVTHNRARLWSDGLTLSEHLSRLHPGSYRVHALKARVLAARNAPVQAIFAAYQDAAATPSRAVFPLIRMRRLVAALLYQYDSDDKLDLDRVDEPRSVAEPLLINRRYLDAMATLLDGAIRQRMATELPNLETVKELEQVRQCMLSNLDLCWKLEREFEEWLLTALRAGKAPAPARARLALLASLMAFERDAPDEALARLDAQVEAGIREPGLLLWRATYLAHLRQFDDAQAQLAALRHDPDPRVQERIVEGRELLQRLRGDAAQR
jgi:hypothetical protein